MPTAKLRFSYRNRVNFGFLIALLFLMIISLYSYRNAVMMIRNNESVEHTRKVTEAIDTVYSHMTDMETGQRGFIITGNDGYLNPYNEARGLINEAMVSLRNLVVDSPTQTERLDRLKEIVFNKINELQDSIDLRRKEGFVETRKYMSTDTGRLLMREIRTTLDDMRSEEIKLLNIRNKAAEESTIKTIRVIIIGSVLAVLFLLCALIFINISERERAVANHKLQSQNQVRAGLLELGEKMAGDLTISLLAQKTIQFLAGYVGAPVATIFLTDQDSGQLRRVGGYGLAVERNENIEAALGEGLVAQAAQQQNPIVVEKIPPDYLRISSSLGETQPRLIYLYPFLHDGQTKGVIEFGLLSPLSESDVEFLTLTLDRISIAFHSAQSRQKVDELLRQTQAQAEELQAQQEELIAANEELQSSSEELQTQQEELRQANEELEEQRTALEEKKEKLEQTNRAMVKARAETEEKARDLEIANQYKSEFLANMSHELRTPLNGILLLAKSLSDDSNLSAQQIEASEGIYSCGVDLLNLINDILDLSKVEAGKLDIKSEQIAMNDIVTSLQNLFGVQMKNNGLGFELKIQSDCPPVMKSDRLRIEQILKNFLSNALKFTESGTVSVQFAKAPAGSGYAVAMSVRDSGIGIPEEKRRFIFEAFSQVDGSLARKYSGTGLGLTIARKLAGLLGGEIILESEEGKGSIFTLLLPMEIESSQDSVAVRSKTSEMPVPSKSVDHTRVYDYEKTHGISDDRGNIHMGDRVILIIDDDKTFAKILFNLCRRHGFKCLVAADGESGLRDAKELKPDAILLDLKLPGMSGQAVLGSLKENLKTRHIPVHVLSMLEKSSELLKMGAVGFLEKPANKSDLEKILNSIETRILSKARKVLIVEDGKIERESIQRLIGDGDVKTVAVESGEAAIDELRKQSFDCMILDLSLPDMTGFELLEAIEKDSSMGPPPIVVHTAKDLSKDEIDKLSKFSESIIIKGVRSQDRLFDEVTLFLHRVTSELPADKRQILEKVRHREQVFEGRKLLIVDDDMRNVFALRNLLLSRGFEIFVGKTGKEALTRLSEHPDIDVVLMDIMMPEMDGYEAMRKIREQHKFKGLPIIALTAKAMVGDREKCLEAGANDYLSKPIDADSLLSLLRVWLTRRV